MSISAIIFIVYRNMRGGLTYARKRSIRMFYRPACLKEDYQQMEVSPRQFKPALKRQRKA